MKGKIWTENEHFEVDLNDAGKVADAMRFKAHAIKAKADPEVFQAAANIIELLTCERDASRGSAESLYKTCERLYEELNAAITQLESTGICDFCAHWDEKVCKKKGKCSWEWAGPEAKRREK